MEQKLQKGFRVEILSRNTDQTRGERWENNSVGSEAIIEFSSLEQKSDWRRGDNDYDQTAPAYSILILNKDGTVRSLKWFEEKYLELICRNVEKGLAILKQHGRLDELGRPVTLSTR